MLADRIEKLQHRRLAWFYTAFLGVLFLGYLIFTLESAFRQRAHPQIRSFAKSEVWKFPAVLIRGRSTPDSSGVWCSILEDDDDEDEDIRGDEPSPKVYRDCIGEYWRLNDPDIPGESTLAIFRLREYYVTHTHTHSCKWLFIMGFLMGLPE